MCNVFENFKDFRSCAPPICLNFENTLILFKTYIMMHDCEKMLLAKIIIRISWPYVEHIFSTFLDTLEYLCVVKIY